MPVPETSAPANPFAAGAAFVEGKYVPIAEARIPILDRGFSRSDATYDVTHVWKGWIFRLDDYIDRFERNMAALRMRLSYSRQEIRDILLECVRLSGLRDAFVQMTCTRGVPPAGSRDPRDCVNQLYCFAIPFIWIAKEEQQQVGLNLHVSSIRRIPPQSLDPRTKNFHWLDLTMGLLEAYDAGCDIDVLTDDRGNLTEGPGFNIFVVRDGRIATPAEGVFDGMTRRTVLELCRETNLQAEEAEVPVKALAKAEEVFITSTAGGVIPITRVGGVPVGDGHPGPVTSRLKQLYWGRKAEGWLSERVDYRD